MRAIRKLRCACLLMYARSALARGLRPLPRLETQLAENYVFARSRFQSRRRSRCESSRLPLKKPRHLPVSGHNNRITILCKVKYTHSTIAYSALLREATLTIYKLTRVRVFDFIICIPPFLAFRVIKSCVNAWRRSHVQIIQALSENVNPVFSFSRHPRVHPGKSCYDSTALERDDSTDITILMSTSTPSRIIRTAVLIFPKKLRKILRPFLCHLRDFQTLRLYHKRAVSST